VLTSVKQIVGNAHFCVKTRVPAILVRVDASVLEIRGHRSCFLRLAVLLGTNRHSSRAPGLPKCIRRTRERYFLADNSGQHRGGIDITDAGLAYLSGLTGLRKLELSDTSLHLSRTQITDAGLANLKGLTSLSSLALNETQVSDAGLRHLKALTGLTTLDLSSTQVTDAGLVHLKDMRSAREASGPVYIAGRLALDVD
jgi:hypothetical protein